MKLFPHKRIVETSRRIAAIITYATKSEIFVHHIVRFCMVAPALLSFFNVTSFRLRISYPRSLAKWSRARRCRANKGNLKQVAMVPTHISLRADTIHTAVPNSFKRRTSSGCIERFAESSSFLAAGLKPVQTKNTSNKFSNRIHRTISLTKCETTLQ